jgi:hypothetical protein
MHAVDLADQLRAGFTTTRRCRRTWKPLLYLLIDLTAINAFRLSSYCDPAYERDFRRASKHSKFHSSLGLALMQRCEQNRSIKATPRIERTDLVAAVSSIAIEYHEREKGLKNNKCKACLAAGRRHEILRRKRKPLAELTNTNWISSTTTGLKHKKHELDAPRTIYGCSACKINICNHPRCWNEHIAAVRQKGWRELQAKRLNNQPSVEALNGMRDTFEYSSSISKEKSPENAIFVEEWSDEGFEDDVW